MILGGRKWEILEEIAYDSKSEGTTWSMTFTNGSIVKS